VVLDTVGYNVQVKHQKTRAGAEAAPPGAAVTIIRRNLFAKGARSAAGELARPNLLVGHFPVRGAGATDEYRIYGNLFVDSPGEALLQAEGNAAIYDNVFVNRVGDGVVIRAHNHRPRTITVFHNTIVALGTGLALSDGEPGYVQTVTGNVVFSRETRIAGGGAGNVIGPLGAADATLALVDLVRGRINPALRSDRPAEPAAAVTPPRPDLPDADRDFFRAPRLAPLPGAVSGVGVELDLDVLRVGSGRRAAR
jgi:hypothetical protein